MKPSMILGVAVVATLLLASAGAAQTSDDAARGKATAPVAGFVDDDGDGVCDNCTAAGQGRGNGQAPARKAGKGKGRGPADGSGNQGVGPRDGSGYGHGSGSGRCDGAGPRSQRGGHGQRQGRRGSRPWS